MRQIIILFLISFGLMINQSAYSLPVGGYMLTVQQSPFTFMNSVPSKVKADGKVDLSFFANQSIVFQYRCRIDGPATAGLITGIVPAEGWSGWTNADISEITVSKFKKGGLYKLRIEYKTHTSNNIFVFVKTFEVSEITPASENSIKSVKKETDLKEQGKNENIVVIGDSLSGAASKSTKIKETDGKYHDDKTLAKDTVILKNTERDVTVVKSDLASLSGTGDQQSTETKDYNKLLLESLSDNNRGLFLSCLNNGANVTMTGAGGGSIFHMINGIFDDEEVISLIKKKGGAINETDDYGNTPLNLSLLTGDLQYSKNLIKQGAEVNIANEQKLAPIHLTILKNNTATFRNLLNSGADINISGQGNYTPLHMAAELNNLEMAKELIAKGARINAKTSQNLTPLDIARIQGNDEMAKLIRSKGRYNYGNSIPSVLNTSSSAVPNIDFSLPYNNALLAKRQNNLLMQKITAPLVVAGIAAAIFFTVEADQSYGSYHNASTEDKAWDYYQKTKQYDRYALAAGGVSLLSIYGFIHSTVKKHKISEKLRKSFVQ